MIEINPTAIKEMHAYVERELNDIVERTFRAAIGPGLRHVQIPRVSIQVDTHINLPTLSHQVTVTSVVTTWPIHSEHHYWTFLIDEMTVQDPPLFRHMWLAMMSQAVEAKSRPLGLQLVQCLERRAVEEEKWIVPDPNMFPVHPGRWAP